MISKNNLVESFNTNDYKVIFIVGATATGKTQLALNLAEKFQGSIINIDSIQCYDKLFIGSAAPTEIEKKRVPHYLFSYVPAPQELTAGQYLRDFYKLLNEKKPQGPLFVVGGTGFYLQALEKGMYDLPEVSEELKQQVFQELQEKPSELIKELKTFDPESEIHDNDLYRIGRALEIKRAFQIKMSAVKKGEFQKNKLPFPLLKLGLDFDSAPEQKKMFQKRVEVRTQAMLQLGLENEVQSLIFEGHLNWAPLASVGYKETVQYLQKEITSEQWPNLITQATLQLVKKQRTWFKRDEAILWSNLFSLKSDSCFEVVQDFLK